jgi:hypothetical protein
MKKIILKNEKICPESQISIDRFCFGSGDTGKITRKMIFSQHLTTAVIGTCGWADVDKTSRAGFCSGVDKARKCHRSGE